MTRRALLMGLVGGAVAVGAVALGFGEGPAPLDDTTQASTTVAPTTTLAPRAAVPTLVLYDTTGEWASIGAADALLSANLLGRFGPVDRVPIGQYTSGLMGRYAGVVYEGTTYDEPLPSAFLDDVAAGVTPVVWAGLNIWQLGDRLQASGYGFSTGEVVERAMSVVRYGDVELTRDVTDGPNPVVPITITDATAARSLGSLLGDDGTELPWGVTARNLTYVGESPYSYVTEGDRYLAWADVLIGVFSPDSPTRHRALVRLEDIGPASDPRLLRESIGVLVDRGIPFTMAVYPLFLDPSGKNGLPYGAKGTPALRLDQRPEVVAAIRYGLDHGGTIVSHGLTHQYERLANPYDGVSGSDFEFYRAVVDAVTDDVVLQGPVPKDSVDWAADRLREARDLLRKAGIPMSEVTMFEVPHYAASDATYRAIGKVYAEANPGRPPTRFERGMYFPLDADGTPDVAAATGQYFPYPVIDVYGQLVVPENLGNVIEVGYNNHDARSPAQIVDSARRSLAVRDGVVGFFFHPYLDASLLEDVVDGIIDVGYDFVPATSIDAGWVGAGAASAADSSPP